MKRIIQILLFITFSTLYNCDDKQNDDSQIKDGIDYIEINGVRKYLTYTKESTYYANKYEGCDYFNPVTGHCETKYRNLTIVDPNHELFTNLNPNYMERIQLEFITNISNYNGLCKTYSSISSNWEDGKILAALIIDEKTTIVAESNQNVSLKTQGENFELTFSDIHYGSNILSGHFTIIMN